MKYSVHPTLLIGLGGTGRIALLEFKKLLFKKGLLKEELNFPRIQFLAIDTEFSTSSSVSDNKSKNDTDLFIEKNYKDRGFQPHEIHSIAQNMTDLQKFLRNPEIYQAKDFVPSENLIKSVIDVAVGHGAAGTGLVGKASMWMANLKILCNKIERMLKESCDHTTINNIIMEQYSNIYNHVNDSKYPQIFILCSLGGGTGKGTFLTTGAIIRETLKKLSQTVSDNAVITLVNFMPSCFSVEGRQVDKNYLNTIKINQYSSFKELEYVLNNGYPIEIELSSALGLTNNSSKSQNIFTHIWNVANFDSYTGGVTNDYQTINSLVSDTIYSFIFNDNVGETARTGNYLANPVSNEKINEVEAPNAKRNTHYGRVGGYIFRYPVNKLMEYSQLYYLLIILEDIVNGHLSPEISFAESRVNDLIKDIDILRFFLIDYRNITPPLFNLFSFNTPDVNINIIIENIKTAFSIYNDYYSNKEEYSSKRENELRKSVKERIQKIEEKLCYIVKNYGIDKAIMTLTELIKKINLNISDSICLPENKLDDPNGEKVQERINLLNEKRKNQEILIESYLDGSSGFYTQLMQKFEEDKRNWESNHSLWKKIGLIESDPKTISESSISYIRQFYEEIGQHFKALYEISEKIFQYKCINYQKDKLLKLKLQLEKYKEMIWAGLETYDDLHLKTQKEMNLLLNKKNPGFEREIIPSTHNIYTEWAKCLMLANERVENEIQNRLNEKFMNSLILNEDLDKNKIYDQIYSVVNEVLKDNRIKHNQSSINDLTAISYLDKMSETKRNETIYDLYNNSNLLGDLSWGKIFGGSNEFALSIVSFKDISNDRKKYFKDIDNFAEIDDPEIIKINKMSRYVPLCVFNEVQDARILYNSSLSTNSINKYNYHTHKDFIDIEEPVGNSYQIPVEDFSTFINLLLHTGVITIPTENSDDFQNANIVKLLNINRSLRLNKYDFFIDERKEGISEEKRISFDEFCRKFSKENTWFPKLVDSLFKRLESLLKLSNQEKRDEAKKILNKYFEFTETERNYPYIPNFVLQYFIRNSNDSSLLKNHIRMYDLENHNKFKIQKAKQNNLHEIRICRTQNELNEFYEVVDFAVFFDYSENELWDLKKGQDIVAVEQTKDEIIQKTKPYYIQYLVKPILDKSDHWIDLKEAGFIGKNEQEKSIKTKENILEEIKADEYFICYKEDGKKRTSLKNIHEVIKMIQNNTDLRIQTVSEQGEKNWKKYEEVNTIKEMLNMELPDFEDEELPDF